MAYGLKVVDHYYGILSPSVMDVSGKELTTWEISPHSSPFPAPIASTPAPLFVTQQRVRAELLNDVSRVVVKLGTGVLTLS